MPGPCEETAIAGRNQVTSEVSQMLWTAFVRFIAFTGGRCLPGGHIKINLYY